MYRLTAINAKAPISTVIVDFDVKLPVLQRLNLQQQTYNV